MILRGKLRSFDGTTYLACVELAGSWAYTVVGVPVSKGIASAELVPGRTVMVAVIEETDPGSMMVLGVR